MDNQQFIIDPLKAQRAVEATAACAADISRSSGQVDQELTSLTVSGASFAGEAQRALAAAHRKAQECAHKLQRDLTELSRLLSGVKGGYVTQDGTTAGAVAQVTKTAGAGLHF